MIKALFVFGGTCWIVAGCIIAATHASVKDWASVLKIAGLALLTTSISAAILAAFVYLF